VDFHTIVTIDVCSLALILWFSYYVCLLTSDNEIMFWRLHDIIVMAFVLVVVFI